MNFEELVKPMLTCEQTKGQTVYQHGVSVKEYFFDLIETPTFDWRYPKWWDNYKYLILENLHSREVISLYTLYHDVGKPHCKVFDEFGKQHFPNHEEVSKKIFLDHGGNETIANLIGWDMKIHVSSADEIQSLLEKEWTIKDAMTLLCASLAEVHSNAGLFGGIQTNSFKSKFKKIERRGNKICKFSFTN